MGRRRYHIGQDIADAGWLGIIAQGFILSRRRWYAAFQPLDAVYKADMQMVHDQFDRVEVFTAGKAPGKIMRRIDRGVKTAAYRTGK